MVQVAIGVEKMPDKKETAVTKYNAIKSDMVSFYKSISNEKTPEVDGSGLKIIDKKPDGMGGSLDYIIEAYMRDRLNYYFPGWSWEQGQIQLLGSEWVIVSAHLTILDEHLLTYGKNPPERRFFGTGAARIQFKKNQPHTAENVIDIDKNVKSANSSALKVAINRLCGIGDDVYRKRIDEDGMGSAEEYDNRLMQEPSTAQVGFTNRVAKSKLSYTNVFKALGVKGLDEITDYEEAWKVIEKKLLGK